MARRRHFLIRVTGFFLKWGIVAILIIVRFAARVIDKLCSHWLIELGIKSERSPEAIREPPRVIKLPEPIKEEWVKFGRIKDGMQIQRNTLTGKKRVIVVSNGQILPVEV